MNEPRYRKVLGASSPYARRSMVTSWSRSECAQAAQGSFQALSHVRERMGYWKRHPRKELEAVLVEFDQAGWKIDDPPTYYRVRCPCGKHYRWIHLTPSNPRYGQEALRWLKRQPCYTSQGAEGGKA